MSKLNLHEFKVFYTTKKVKLQMKIKSKYKHTNEYLRANSKIWRADFKEFRGNIASSGSKIKHLTQIESEKTHKYLVFSTTRLNRILTDRKYKKHAHNVRTKAFFYVTWRNASRWRHRVFNKVEDKHIEFENHIIGKVWKKLCSFVPQERERQAVILILTTLIIYLTFESTIFLDNALLVYANDEYIGAIEKDDTIKMEDMINDLLLIGEKEVGDATLSDDNIVGMDIEFVPTRVGKEELITYTDVLQKLSTATEFKIEAYEVLVNGESVGYVKDSSVYEKALARHVATYLPEEKEGIEIQSISITDEVMLSKTEVYDRRLKTEDEIYDIISKAVIANKIYVVKEGDSIWQIANDNDMTLDELLDINPNITENGAIYPGDELSLVKEVPRVSVQVTYLSTFTDIAYRDIEEVPNNDKYVTYKKVLQEGSDGKSTFVVEMKTVNGVESKRDLISEEVIVAPVKKIVEVGTLNTPPKSASGNFKLPASGRRTDYFGARGGTHKGIDIAAPAGTPVYASDGGTVKFAGWYGAYGNLVIIDHGNGYQTYYGHNSKIYVSAGQKVYQGQHLAAMGTTGRSTGNHCHFEIRKNGVPVNPVPYLK